MEDEVKLNKKEIEFHLSIREQITSLAKRVAEKLNKEIERGHDTVAFMIAILLASFLDFSGLIVEVIGWLFTPAFGVGAVLIYINGLLSFFVSAILTYFMWGKGMFIKGRIWLIWIICGIFFENLPAFKALPLSSLGVLYAWHIVKKRSKKAEVVFAKLSDLTEQELNILDQNIGTLENLNERNV